MTLLAPWQWNSPLGSLLMLFGCTLDSSIYFSAQQKTSENSDILKMTIKFSIYEMGIDILSLLHCIRVASISQVYCSWSECKSQFDQKLGNFQCSMAILQQHQSLLTLAQILSHSATWQSNPIIRCKETVSGAPENFANEPWSHSLV